MKFYRVLHIFILGWVGSDRSRVRITEKDRTYYIFNMMTIRSCDGVVKDGNATKNKMYTQFYDNFLLVASLSTSISKYLYRSQNESQMIRMWFELWSAG